MIEFGQCYDCASPSISPHNSEVKAAVVLAAFMIQDLPQAPMSVGNGTSAGNGDSPGVCKKWSISTRVAFFILCIVVVWMGSALWLIGLRCKVPSAIRAAGQLRQDLQVLQSQLKQQHLDTVRLTQEAVRGLNETMEVRVLQPCSADPV